MNIPEIKVKFVSLFRKKTFILAGALSIIVFLLSTSLLIINSNKSSQQPDKTWQIEVTYNSNVKKLSLDKLIVINRKTVPDERSALYSPFKLQVLGKNGNVIFQEKVNITEQILYDLFINAPDSNLSMPKDLKSVIFVPFQVDGAKIIILRDSNTVLQINLPILTSFGFIKSAQAASQSVSCGPVTTVFINDNYTNTDKFKSDVSYLENLYNTIPPYNINPSVFDFKEVDSAQSFGCATLGMTSCINNLQIAIKNAGLRYFPNAQKFIVLVDNPNALTVDGGIAGLVNGMGGDVIIYTNYVYPGLAGGKAFAAAAHELEGHAVGYLWDRYVSSDPKYSVMASGDLPSNCSTNPQGETFWPGAGSTGVFKGCGNQAQYAPYPLTCQSNTKALISGGTNDTIMSAIGCSPNEFDSVEQAWIVNNILPYYKPCSGVPLATITPSPIVILPPTVPPTPLPTAISHSISGTAFVDSNGNGKQDAGELGYAGLTVNLTGSFSGSMITDGFGKYSFINIPVGNYSISARDSRITFGLVNLSPIAQNTINETIDFPIPASALNTSMPIVSATPTPTPVVVTEPVVLSSPTPTPNPGATYTCVMDPSCASAQNSIQMCYLKCIPN